MNQEYVLLGALAWKILGKRIYLWRNHHTGNFWTDVAVHFSTKVFCTSRFSYTARFPKTVLMPVGADTELFVPDPHIRIPRSVLFLARIAPSKRLHVLIEALGKLSGTGAAFTASIYGSALVTDELYVEQLKQRAWQLGLGHKVHWHSGVPHAAAARVFASHDIFVNLSPSGMYDKTIFEAAASGALVLASSLDFAAAAGERFSFKEDSVDDLAAKLRTFLSLPARERETDVQTLQDLARQNSVEALMSRLVAEMSRASVGPHQ